MKIVEVEHMNHLSFDVLVVGAGAAGLMAAHELALSGRTVAILEAKEKAGGRINTHRENGFSVELGAEFIHGDLPLTKELLKKAGASLSPVRGSLWQAKGGRIQQQENFITHYPVLEQKCHSVQADMPVAQFLQKELQGEKYATLRFSLQNYIEGYDAADPAKASTKALCRELTKNNEEQFRIPGGYGQLVAYLEQECRKAGVQFFFEQAVQQLHWKRGHVTAITPAVTLEGKMVLLTVSLGVLQKDGILVFPALPQVKKAVLALGFGHVIKVVILFSTAFWKTAGHTGGKDLSDLNFLFSQEALPTWWTHYPLQEPLLTGWLGGLRAEVMQFFQKEDFVHKALLSLSHIFRLDVAVLQQMIVKTWFYNWSEDPHFRGAYSYAVVNGPEAVGLLQQPVEQTIFFGGEALQEGPTIGTVEGALSSGKAAAQRMLACFGSRSVPGR